MTLSPGCIIVVSPATLVLMKVVQCPGSNNLNSTQLFLEAGCHMQNYGLQGDDLRYQLVNKFFTFYTSL